MKNKTCGECRYHKNMRCNLPPKTFIIVPETESCRHFTQKPKMTNGDKIRQMSDEELAMIFVCKMDGGVFYSHFTGGFYVSQEKAIAATLAELKKEWKE